ncbi:MAG: O-antigen ligase family protein [Deltaproteobacteria bacterium]|nr:O-antigen ligase family protein [Deltaproteobacteria bacterium]
MQSLSSSPLGAQKLCDKPPLLTCVWRNARVLALTVLDNIISFETFFVLFVLAGVYKADPLFDVVPVDLTAAFFCASSLVGVRIVGHRKFRFPRTSGRILGFWFLFISYIAISFLWTPGSVYAADKLFLVWTTTTWAIMGAAIVIAPDPCRVTRFFLILLFLALFLSVRIGISIVSVGPKIFLSDLQSSYLGLGQVVGEGAIVSYILCCYHNHNKFTRVALLLITVLFIFILITLGGRAPFVALVLSICVPFIFLVRISANSFFIRRTTIYGAAFVAVGVAVISYSTLQTDAGRTLARLGSLTEKGMGESAGTRIRNYYTALDLIDERPFFGHGVGSWPLLVGLPDERSYPHNMILETTVEGGLVELLVLATFLCYAVQLLRPLRQAFTDAERMLLSVSIIYFFINSMISGDVPDNRFFFVLVGLTACVKNRGIAHAKDSPYHDGAQRR